VPTNNAKLLAGALAIECTKIALPPTPLLWIEDLMEFRAANTRAVKTRTEVMKPKDLSRVYLTAANKRLIFFKLRDKSCMYVGSSWRPCLLQTMENSLSLPAHRKE
jgi:hypothetical protein